ncbi:MAG: FAD-dependent monooxygenase [Hydrogenophaga sp.]|jgi:3-(3-hydroxy-phenyl)propionate hydroxylase|nr:FAD-dependent monooxygenase [Hydrogenophaga sp.]
MHVPAAEPRPSLYYRHEVFTPWLASSHPPQPVAPVVVAGAGPIGLVTALALAQQGVRCVVLESERQVCEGSRAIVFTRRSMEILQQVGVADAVTAQGLAWRIGHSFYRDQRVYRMEAPHDPDDRFFPMINLQQQYLEEILVRAAQAHPLVELRWGNRVVGLQQTEALAQLEVDTPEGPYTLQTRWLVAADGARSGLRGLLNLKLEGASYEGRFVIADIRVDLPLPTERLAFFDPPWNPGNTILMHREPHGIWRVDYQLPPGESPEQALQPESLSERINAQLAMIGHAGAPWEMDWCSVYSARALTLPDYVHGRVLFVGDAAHLLPIFGVRGANTGFQDAQALAWRLALVAKGLADPQLLVTYSQERVGAAREIIDEAGKSTRFMTPPSRGFRLLRDAVLSLSLTQPFVGPLFHWRTSRAHEYRDSTANSPDTWRGMFSGGFVPGAPAQNICLGPDDHLFDHLTHGFTLLWFSNENHLPQAVRTAQNRWQARGLSLKLLVVGHGEVDGADRSFDDPQGHFRERYGVRAPAAAYLLRPDHHVCARWSAQNATALAAALGQELGGALSRACSLEGETA